LGKEARPKVFEGFIGKNVASPLERLRSMKTSRKRLLAALGD
jgi:hypothetical protein